GSRRRPCRRSSRRTTSAAAAAPAVAPGPAPWGWLRCTPRRRLEPFAYTTSMRHVLAKALKIVMVPPPDAHFVLPCAFGAGRGPRTGALAFDPSLEFKTPSPHRESARCPEMSTIQDRSDGTMT